MENKAPSVIPVSGIFMLVFFICAFCSSMYGIWNIHDKTETMEWHDLANGQWTSMYESHFDKGLHFHDNSKNIWGLGNYAFFKEGRSGVLIGDNDWLFTSEEFLFPADAQINIKKNLSYIVNTQEYLKTQNVNLLVALVPAKARIYEDKLGRYQWPHEWHSLYHDTRKKFQELEIPTTDIAWLFEKKKNDFDIFFKTDTHWTPTGAKMAARSIADEVAENFPDLPIHQQQYFSDRNDVIHHEGDLMRYIPLGGKHREFGPDQDEFKKAITYKKENKQTDALEDTLFGDQNVPITLVGTSYSANSLWNFDGFLKEALGVDIINAADEGLGPFETMAKYLNDQAFKSNKPELIIWEVPERYLVMPYNLEAAS